MTSSEKQSALNVRSILSESSQDMTNMLENLSKLRSLSEDDKTEAAMLRGRIDEQSQLIMILKQRADEALSRTQTVDKINKELTEFRDHANERLEQELRKFNILDQRFHDLASNHEEMIKFKDEYKRVNKELRQENARLRDENARLFSKAIQEKDSQIDELAKKCLAIKEQYTGLEQRTRQLQQELREKENAYRNSIQNMTENHRTELKSFQHKLQESEERLKSVTHKLHMQTDSNENAVVETNSKISQLTKERDELLDLTMQRGKIITKEQAENKKLLKRVEEMEKAVKNMEEKFERESVAVNSNLQVRKLKDDLFDANFKYDEMVKEFGAFKKHSNELLQQEKDLNERLRHLVG